MTGRKVLLPMEEFDSAKHKIDLGLETDEIAGISIKSKPSLANRKPGAEIAQTRARARLRR